VHASDPLRPGQWTFDHCDFEALWPRQNGAGITVAVLDSGADGRIPDLQGQVLQGQTFITSDKPNGADYNPIPADPAVNPDPFGHGTTVASVIAAKADGQGMVGAAPGVKILPVVVDDNTGHERREVSSAGADDVADAVGWAVNRGANVINMSFGEVKAWPQDQAAIGYAEQHGVVVVVASGNWPVTDPNYPAAFDNVLAVGGMDSNGELDPTSVTGSYLDAVAPGGDVTVALQPDGCVLGARVRTVLRTRHRHVGCGAVRIRPRGVGASRAPGVDCRADPCTHRDNRARRRARGKDQYFGSGLIAPRAAVGC
jgi:subtilisin family serine protease